MTYILDANALIAYLSREPGADVVEGILLDPGAVCVAHGVNVCEVYYQAIRESGEAAAETAISNLVRVGVHIREDFDEAFWKAVGKIKAAHRLSLADAFAVALTQRVNGELVTSDHHELDPLAAAGVCPISFFR
jgi:predicted nucleic acid-binding protein